MEITQVGDATLICGDCMEVLPTLLDFCMGSGSTCVAALQEGRKAIGIELDKGYYDTAVKRCQEMLEAIGHDD